jgi:hypothetical protein
MHMLMRETAADGRRTRARPGHQSNSSYPFRNFTSLMPRLISRLLTRLEHAPRSRRVPVEPIRRRRKIPLRGPVLPSLLPYGRTRSILLDDVNPIINPSAYKRHKSLPPRVRIHNLPRRKAAVTDEHDRPRHMTEEERKWWASPYCTWYDVPFCLC